MIDKLAILVPDATYHVYNRANGNERLFRNSENYDHFLLKYQEYISPIAETFCYCLMPNHIHFLIRVKSSEEISSVINGRIEQERRPSATLHGFQTLEGFHRDAAISKFLTQQFSHLFNSYTQAINKKYKRKGSLMMHPYKRILVRDVNYRFNLIRYIHYNPLEAGLCADLKGWPHSSYKLILEEDNSFLNSTELINWYFDVENFKLIHSNNIGLDSIDFEDFTHP